MKSDQSFYRFRLLLNDPHIRRDRSKAPNLDPQVAIKQILLPRTVKEGPTAINPTWQSDFQKNVVKVETDQTLMRLGQFYTKIKSIEGLAVSIKRRLDSSPDKFEEDEKMIGGLVDQMNTKLGEVSTVFNIVDEVEERLTAVFSRYNNSRGLQASPSSFRTDQNLSRSPGKQSVVQNMDPDQLVRELTYERILNRNMRKEVEEERIKCLEERKRCDDERWRYEQETRRYEEEKMKSAVLVSENNLLVDENRRYLEELRRYRAGKEDEMFKRQSMHDKTAAISRQLEAVRAQMRGLEVENSLLKEREIISSQEKFTLEERIRSLMNDGKKFEVGYKNILDPRRESAEEQTRKELQEQESKLRDQEVYGLMNKISELERENYQLRQRDAEREAERNKLWQRDQERQRELERQREFEKQREQDRQRELQREAAMRQSRAVVERNEINIRPYQSSANLYSQRPKDNQYDGGQRNTLNNAPMKEHNKKTIFGEQQMYERINTLNPSLIGSEPHNPSMAASTPTRIREKPINLTPEQNKSSTRIADMEIPTSKLMKRLSATEKKPLTVPLLEPDGMISDRPLTFGGSQLSTQRNWQADAHLVDEPRQNDAVPMATHAQPYINIKALTEGNNANEDTSHIQTRSLKPAYIDMAELVKSRGERSSSPHIKTFELKKKKQE